MTEPVEAVTYRQADSADSYEVFKVFRRSLADLLARNGDDGAIDTGEEALSDDWLRWRSLYEHLAQTGSEFWIAERGGQPAGYARSIVRDGLLELTEFFVAPGQQAAGLGHGLLSRAFPSGAARRRAIIATADPPAQALYLKAGVYPRFDLRFFGRTPEAVPFQSDLAITPMLPSPDTLESLARLDQVVLGHRRDPDHAWLLSDRQGFLYSRDGRPVGYGYVGSWSGPFALSEARDFPAVLAHAESEAAAMGLEEFGVEVPMVNRTAVDYLLGRGFRFDSFLAFMMTDEPFGRFENYLYTSVPFFM
jgi:GNAT superfamily N-acetyltransferase